MRIIGTWSFVPSLCCDSSCISHHLFVCILNWVNSPGLSLHLRYSSVSRCLIAWLSLHDFLEELSRKCLKKHVTSCDTRCASVRVAPLAIMQRFVGVSFSSACIAGINLCGLIGLADQSSWFSWCWWLLLFRWSVEMLATRNQSCRSARGTASPLHWQSVRVANLDLHILRKWFAEFDRALTWLGYQLSSRERAIVTEVSEAAQQRGRPGCLYTVNTCKYYNII